MKKISVPMWEAADGARFEDADDAQRYEISSRLRLLINNDDFIITQPRDTHHRMADWIANHKEEVMEILTANYAEEDIEGLTCHISKD